MSRLRPYLPYLALTLFTLLAAEPLARADFVCSDDIAFHLFRAVELGTLIQAGHFFPRWAPHMALGYGYPFYNFYAPLSSYFVVLLHAFGFAYPAALKLAFGLAIGFAGLGAFLFARDLVGERPALVAAWAYLFAPYFAYDILFRGNFAETLAFGWLPLTLWALRRALQPPPSHTPTPSAPKTASLPHCLLHTRIPLFYAALILTHNIFALIASPLFFGYVALSAGQQRSSKVLVRGALWLLLGIALTTYFWLPAIIERTLVHSERLLVPPVFTWYTNFIPLSDLLARPHLPDPLLINPSPARALGLVPLLLCLPALLYFFFRRAPRRIGDAHSLTTSPLGWGDWNLGFFALALIGYGFMTLAVSSPIWELIKPLELVQFPWRFLGPAALCLAIVLGYSVRALEQFGARPASLFTFHALLPSFIFILFLSNLAYWYPRYCPASPTASVADMLNYEIATATLGTTAKGEYLPRTTAYLPADDSLAQALLNNQSPAYLTGLPATAHLQITRPDVLNYQANITTPTAFQITFNQLYYPGWRVFVDRQPAALQLTPDTGLITALVPSGAHTLRFTFGLTPLRVVAVAISLVSLIALFIFAIWNLQFISPAPSLTRFHTEQTQLGLPTLAFITLLLFLKLVFLNSFPASRLNLTTDQLAGVQHPLAADFEHNFHLYGYDLSRPSLPTDDFFDAALYLGLRDYTPARYLPNFVIEDPTGLNWLGDAYPPRWHKEPPPVFVWAPGTYAQWARHITPLPGTPPGDYELFTSIFNQDTLHPASVLDANGQAIAPRLSLGALTLTRPTRPFALVPEHPAPHDFGDLTLLGYNLDRDSANTGDTILLTLYWKSDTAPQTDYTARVDFVTPNGVPVSGVDLPPVNLYPTRLWQPDDQWRGQHRLRLPPARPATPSPLQNTRATPPPAPSPLGLLTVTAPTRTFTRPFIQHELTATLGDLAALDGYSLSSSSLTLTLTLHWRALTTPALAYSVFVHLADDTGHVWAQADSAPAHWTRPTTSWLPGEYLADDHTLTLPADLPPGNYHFIVGMYDPATNTRLTPSGPAAISDNRVEITTLVLP